MGIWALICEKIIKPWHQTHREALAASISAPQISALVALLSVSIAVEGEQIRQASRVTCFCRSAAFAAALQSRFIHARPDGSARVSSRPPCRSPGRPTAELLRVCWGGRGK